jgi:hypothetical protein
MRKISIVILLFFATVLSFYACKRSDNPNLNPGTPAQLTVHLTDDPAEYDHVYLDIQQVGITMTGSSEVVLDLFRPGVYDLLRFRNGLDTLLLRTVVFAGTVGQIRLILGNNNSVVAGGVSYPLTTPSAQESGVKLNLNETFVANGSYDVWIDFDAAKSILQTGNGAYKLKPVMRAYSSLTLGNIQGYVLPLSAFATVYAINGTDTASAIPSQVDGFFEINGLNAATYQLVIDPGVTGLQPYFQSNIQVVYGVGTNAGTITLHP